MPEQPSEKNPVPQELSLEPDDVNDFTEDVIEKLRDDLAAFFPPPGFLDEGLAGADDLKMAVESIDWDYTFERVGREYLHFKISKFRAGDISTPVKTIEFIHGQKPIIKSTDTERKNTSIDVLETMKEMEILEQQLNLQRNGLHD